MIPALWHAHRPRDMGVPGAVASAGTMTEPEARTIIVVMGRRGVVGVRRLTRRDTLKGVAASLVATAVKDSPLPALAAVVAPPPRRPLDFRPFEDALARLGPSQRGRLDAFVSEATAPQLQHDLAAGRYSAADLVAYYVDRIRRIDAIHLRSVIDLNPDALELRPPWTRNGARVACAVHFTASRFCSRTTSAPGIGSAPRPARPP